MSTEPRITEVQLPTELIEIENSLQQFLPQPSAVHRDTLMYRAGWSAAKTQPPSGAHWIWPMSSAALAATLLFTLAFPWASPLQRAGTERSTDAASGVEIINPTTRASRPDRWATPGLPPRRYSANIPLLVLRERALRYDFNELPIDSVTDDSPIPAETTNRQLLEELLPTTRMRSEQFQIWHGWSFGESS